MSTRIELSAGWVEVRCVADIAQLLQSRPSPDAPPAKEPE